jgi:hypothetical protein
LDQFTPSFLQPSGVLTVMLPKSPEEQKKKTIPVAVK